MSVTEFDGRPLVVGSLTGVRSWTVDSLGRLHGVVYPAVWRPGWNRAQCGGDAGDAIVGGYHLTTSMALTRLLAAEYLAPSRKPASEPVSLVKKPKHHPGQLHCKCGFYAYYDNDDNPHHSDGQVLGLVEGAGVLTAGSRGFRAEKARIVALVKPKRDGRPLDNLARHCDNAAIAGVGVSGSVLGFVSTISAATSPLPWLTAISASLFILGMLATYLAFRAIDVQGPRTPEGLALVRRNYPDVPVYRSLRAARRAHPVTPPPAPVLPSPDDPDFWTRSAS